MQGVELYIWDDTGGQWVKLAGTAGGAMSIHAIVEELNDIDDVSVAAPSDLDILYWDDGNSLWKARSFASWSLVTGIEFIIDGGGSEIATGQHGHLEIPFACTINRVTLLADQSGDIKIDIWKDTYANFPPTDADTITGGNEPEIVAGVKDQDDVLNLWTTSISAGDILAYNVDSVTDIERVTISLKVTRT